MPSSSARTLKSPRRLQRRRDRRSPSPHWQFLRGFIKNPVMVGSIIPSSRVLIDKMLDTNADFTHYLRERIDDPRLITVTGSAADVEKILADRNFGSADYVLSGLPFSTLPPGVGDDIAKATAKVLRPGGAFLVYQFSPKVFDFIKPHFEPIKRGFEWINVPPATLFWAYKGEPKA